MKKILLSMIILTLWLNSLAQSQMGFSFGGNLSYLTIDSSSLPIKYTKPGINAGIFWNIKTGYKQYIEIGGFYSQQGALFKNEYFFNNMDSMTTEKIIATTNSNISYIKIPLVWKQVWGDWYTKLGLYGEMKTFAKSSWAVEHIRIDTNYTERGVYSSFSRNMRQYDMGLDMEIGVQFQISNQYDFFINTAYNMGVLAINPDELDNANRMYNRFFTISIGIIVAGNKNSYRRR